MTGLDAIILTGGQGSRLGGAEKSALIGVDGLTTLQRTVVACREVNAGRVVVVGPPHTAGELDVEVTQESPPGSGPAAAIAAGWALLESDGLTDGNVVVLACDMPNVAPGVKALVAAGSGGDGAIAVDGGQKQWLLALLRRAALAKACARLDWSAGDPSVRRLLGDLDLAEVAVPAGTADDLDTPEDLSSLGYTS